MSCLHSSATMIAQTLSSKRRIAAEVRGQVALQRAANQRGGRFDGGGKSDRPSFNSAASAVRSFYGASWQGQLLTVIINNGPRPRFCTTSARLAPSGKYSV
ncbi:MAG: hypothetical protein GPOALKHO_001467 [Sodalis sp.]|nr:MAG: hypothetical protein GPOALKHO_001467 [Sodalis sp.]